MHPIHMKFLIFGSSGAGKSTLLDIMQKVEPRATIHIRDTTRPPRPTEPKEGTCEKRFITRQEFEKRLKNNEYDVVSESYGHFYGVRRDQLIRAFQNKEAHLILLRDISAVKRFKFMYPDAKAIYVHADPRDIPERLKKRDGVNCNERLRRTQSEYNEFVANNTLFDHIVVNFWDIDNAVKQIENIFHYYTKDAARNL